MKKGVEFFENAGSEVSIGGIHAGVVVGISNAIAGINGALTSDDRGNVEAVFSVGCPRSRPSTRGGGERRIVREKNAGISNALPPVQTTKGGVRGGNGGHGHDEDEELGDEHADWMSLLLLLRNKPPEQQASLGPKRPAPDPFRG